MGPTKGDEGRPTSPLSSSGSSQEALQRLLALGKAVLAERDLDAVLTAALDGVISLCKAERGLIVLFGDDGEVIVEQARHLSRERLDEPAFEISRSVIEQVRAAGEGFWSSNVVDDPSLGQRASVVRLALLSVICEPIRFDDTTIGVVYLDNRSIEGRFDASDAALVAQFGDFISLAAGHARERHRLQGRIDALSAQLGQQFDFGAIVARDPAMLGVLKLVSQVADTDATVLIRGESGTGKELVARALHANGRRRTRPFVAVNCGALPENLLEAELFGHRRGAYTGAVDDREGWFERAGDGTLFLDEIGELTPSLQVKLLRVLETGAFAPVGSSRMRQSRARIVAATHRDLETMVRDGSLREDFFYRLNVVSLCVPPLRERPVDVPLLIDHFFTELTAHHAKPDLVLDPAARSALLGHRYPGNVRELRNRIERGVLFADGNRVTADAFGAAPVEQVPKGRFNEAKRAVVERFERDFLHRALAGSSGNISQAARDAGLDYKNFYTKMRRLGIDPTRYKSPESGRHGC